MGELGAAVEDVSLSDLAAAVVHNMQEVDLNLRQIGTVDGSDTDEQGGGYECCRQYLLQEGQALRPCPLFSDVVSRRAQ